VGTRFTVLLGVPVVVIGTIFAEPIMRLWLSPVPEIGKDYIICAQVLVLWTLVQFTQYAVGTQWTVLLGMKKLDFLFWLTLPMALVNIAASVLLVIYTDLGVVGVVIPTTIISLIRRPIVAAYTARAVGVPVRRYLAGGYGRPVIVLGILAGLAYLLLLAMPIDSLLRLGLAVALIGAGWAVLCWVIGFDAQDRARFRSVAEAAWQRVRGRPRVGCCPKCGYDLRGLTEPRCPECGTDCKVSTQLT
jgi:O-antigen/teichoic acid export membrane protein